MGTRAFDTYGLEQEAQLLQEFVEDVTVGRIICFTVRVGAQITFISALHISVILQSEHWKAPMISLEDHHEFIHSSSHPSI